MGENLLSSLKRFISNELIIFLDFLSNLTANCLIINIIILFYLRTTFNLVSRITLLVLKTSTEIVILFNFTILQLLYSLTGTRISRDGKYNKNGNLSIQILHDQFWRDEFVTYSRIKNPTTNNTILGPITKFLQPVESSSIEIIGEPFPKLNARPLKLTGDESNDTILHEDERPPSTLNIQELGDETFGALSFSQLKRLKSKSLQYRLRKQTNRDDFELADNVSIESLRKRLRLKWRLSNSG